MALYGTGAGARPLQKGFDDNTSYQRPVLPTHDAVVEELRDWDHARAYLGKERHYPDFLRFFQREIEAHGWEAVLTTYLFQGGDAADDMLARLFSGFLHPLIQLMYGMEWAQPALVASALAQIAVHKPDTVKDFLLESERLARNQASPSPSILTLLSEIHSSPILASSAHFSDGNKIRDGVFARARAEMLALTSLVSVPPSSLAEATAEMFHACVYTASAAALLFHPPKPPKYDFFLIHHVNGAPFFLTVNKMGWIPLETKARLLEWKVRMDLIQYAARGTPQLEMEKVAGYRPRNREGKEPIDVIARLHELADDGHAIKLGRAALICRDICRPYEDRDWIKIKGDELWMNVFRLVVDSVEAPGPNWVRTCGLAEAWEVGYCRGGSLVSANNNTGYSRRPGCSTINIHLSTYPPPFPE